MANSGDLIPPRKRDSDEPQWKKALKKAEENLVFFPWHADCVESTWHPVQYDLNTLKEANDLGPTENWSGYLIKMAVGDSPMSVEEIPFWGMKRFIQWAGENVDEDGLVTGVYKLETVNGRRQGEWKS